MDPTPVELQQLTCYFAGDLILNSSHLLDSHGFKPSLSCCIRNQGELDFIILQNAAFLTGKRYFVRRVAL